MAQHYAHRTKVKRATKKIFCFCTEGAVLACFFNCIYSMILHSSHASNGMEIIKKASHVAVAVSIAPFGSCLFRLAHMINYRFRGRTQAHKCVRRSPFASSVSNAISPFSGANGKMLCFDNFTIFSSRFRLQGICFLVIFYSRSAIATTICIVVASFSLPFAHLVIYRSGNYLITNERKFRSLCQRHIAFVVPKTANSKRLRFVQSSRCRTRRERQIENYGFLCFWAHPNGRVWRISCVCLCMSANWP